MFAKITNKTDKKISFARALRSANDSNISYFKFSTSNCKNQLSFAE